MLPKHLTLEVVTPDRRVVQGSVDELQLPGLHGYLGILPGHAPLIAELGIGELSYRGDGRIHRLTAIRGFAEVLPDRVIVLAEISERAEEIDVQRAAAARDRARERLSKPGAPDLDWDRATFALQRALIRLQVSSRGGAAAGAAEAETRQVPQ